MNKMKFLQAVAVDLRKAWLCNVGYHDNPLSKEEVAALDEVVLRTKGPDLVFTLGELFHKDPDSVDKHIQVMESLGLHAGERAIGIRQNSPLQIEIIARVNDEPKLQRIAAFVKEAAPFFRATSSAERSHQRITQ